MDPTSTSSTSPSSSKKRRREEEDAVVEENEDLAVSLVSIEKDMSFLRDLLVSWGEDPKLLIPEQLPKRTISVTGTMSSGKSSFVNAFFGIRVKAELLGETDTNFTIVETVSETEFRDIVDHRFSVRYKDLSGIKESDMFEEVSARIGYQANRCFYVLSADQTFERYNQQNNFFSPQLREQMQQYHSLFQAVLINEKIYESNLALRGEPMRQHLAKQTILIDTPGIKTNHIMPAIKHVVTHSDQNLFLIGADCINNRETQDAVDIIKSAINPLHPYGNQSSGTNNPPPPTVLCGVATAIWDRTLILMTKSDILQTREEQDTATFNLGQLFPLRSPVVPPPYHMVYRISLPHKRTSGNGDRYEELMKRLTGHSLVSVHAERSSRVVKVCEVLDAKMKGSIRSGLRTGWQWVFHLGDTDHKRVLQLRDKYKKRAFLVGKRLKTPAHHNEKEENDDDSDGDSDDDDDQDDIYDDAANENGDDNNKEQQVAQRSS